MQIQRYPATTIESFAKPCDSSKGKLHDVRRCNLLFFLLIIGREFLEILLFFSVLLPLAGGHGGQDGRGERWLKVKG